MEGTGRMMIISVCVCVVFFFGFSGQREERKSRHRTLLLEQSLVHAGCVFLCTC